MQARSSQLLLTTGVSTHTIGSPSSMGSPDELSAAVATLAEYAASWLDGLEGLVQPSTVEAYAGRLQQHVLPRLGERRLDEVALDDILALISDLRKSGYSGATVVAILTPLSRLFGASGAAGPDRGQPREQARPERTATHLEARTACAQP